MSLEREREREVVLTLKIDILMKHYEFKKEWMNVHNEIYNMHLQNFHFVPILNSA